MVDVDALWDFSDPGASLDRFRAAAEDARGDQRRVLSTQVARALGILDRFDQARAVLDEIVTGLRPPVTAEVGVRMALERGRVERSRALAHPGSSPGDPRARPLGLFREAALLAHAAGLEALEMDAWHMVCLEVPAEEQVDAHERALARAEACRDPRARAWAGSLLHNLGMTHADAGRNEAALEAFTRALAVREEQGDVERERIARWMVGWTLRLLGRLEEALAVQTALRADLDAAGLEDPYVDEELALLRR
ncbi:tetratricopeptide repeat protein [Nocardioides bruguierae]|uniref:Tetratricopeptide repeat protein n=1 Tax=Nocardioides bruguierae TaxID=2945102 RepID=A0A9X2D5U1_9ACTN|nr:tetratricopeptide repeat protein [Nocardioides bruguierae]MCM0619888.1 tetratricopeptide repeat protein [Nocardioides bruguierae]